MVTYRSPLAERAGARNEDDVVLEFLCTRSHERSNHEGAVGDKSNVHPGVPKGTGHVMVEVFFFGKCKPRKGLQSVAGVRLVSIMMRVVPL